MAVDPLSPEPPEDEKKGDERQAERRRKRWLGLRPGAERNAGHPAAPAVARRQTDDARLPRQARNAGREPRLPDGGVDRGPTVSSTRNRRAS